MENNTLVQVIAKECSYFRGAKPSEATIDLSVKFDRTYLKSLGKFTITAKIERRVDGEDKAFGPNDDINLDFEFGLHSNETFDQLEWNQFRLCFKNGRCLDSNERFRVLVQICTCYGQALCYGSSQIITATDYALRITEAYGNSDEGNSVTWYQQPKKGFLQLAVTIDTTDSIVPLMFIHEKLRIQVIYEDGTPAPIYTLKKKGVPLLDLLTATPEEHSFYTIYDSIDLKARFNEVSFHHGLVRGGFRFRVSNIPVLEKPVAERIVLHPASSETPIYVRSKKTKSGKKEIPCLLEPYGLHETPDLAELKEILASTQDLFEDM